MRPWDAAALRAALVGPAGPWARLDVVDRVGSTNAELLAAAAQGAPDRTVLVAEHQDAGRGRLGRAWTTLPGAGIAVSVLLRPHTVSPDRFGWLPLLTGLAVHDAVHAAVPARTCLKWPNDLLVGEAQRKAGGILAEATTGPDGTAVVLGIGLNVTGPPDGLPPGATSLAAEGAGELDRAALLVSVLTRLAAREAAWRTAGGEPDVDHLRGDYRAVCGSLGAEVRVELPGGMSVTGMAEDVDGDGRLLLLGADGQRRAIAAGDVVHLRPVDRPDPTPARD
jgi:BirA family transcriptional regulator, biotin operon repressor / biotin---[acetyl-CoA-carboxylase] ligase